MAYILGCVRRIERGPRPPRRGHVRRDFSAKVSTPWSGPISGQRVHTKHVEVLSATCRRPYRSGLSPAAVSRAVATCGPTPLIARSLGATAAGEVVELCVELDDVGVEVLPTACQCAQSGLGGIERGVRQAAMEPGGGGNDLLCVHAAQALTQLIGSGVDHGVDLVGGLRAGLHGAAPSDAQQTDRLHSPSRRLRGAGCFAGLHGTSSSDRISGVGLTEAAATLPVRTHHLHDTHALSGEEPVQTGTPRPGAFDTDRVDVAETSQPAQQLAIPGLGGRERCRACSRPSWSSAAAT